MATPFVSEIRMFSFAFAPKGWAFCNGQLLPISQNQALFSLIGTFYGGNGQSNFALPDLRGSMPIHRSSAFTIGQVGGEESHTLTVSEIPQHNHSLKGTGDAATTGVPSGALPAVPGGTIGNVYAAAANLMPAAPQALTATGGQPHENRMPFLTINFCIALQGVFPSRN